MAVISAHGLYKSYGHTPVLNGVDLSLDAGRILGLIGRNGAGKSTLLNVLAGFTACEGELSVLDRQPWRERAQLMQDMCFIADVAVLPRWMRVSDILDYTSGVHPRFDRRRAEALLAATTIAPDARIRSLSKGMVTQLHLTLALAIDARLMVLDEPTQGLDAVFRKQFYDILLEDFLERGRTVILATHEIGEMAHVLTDFAFIDGGRIVRHGPVEDLDTRYSEVTPRTDKLSAARALTPFHERPGLTGPVLLFDGADRDQLAAFGEVRSPGLEALFLATVTRGDAA